MDDVEDDILIGEGVRLSSGAAPLPFRIVSGFIDILATGVALIAAGWLMGSFFTNVGGAAAQAAVIVFIVVVLVLAPATIETLTRGLSLGRWAMGLRIVRDDGGPVSFRQAFTRAVVGVLEIWVSGGTIAVTVSMLSARGKRVGDYLAGTYSLRTRGTLPALPPIIMPAALAEWSRTADITRLPDGLALTARLFLARAPAMHAASRARLGTRLAGRLGEHVAPKPPSGTHPETFIAAVLATRRDREYATALRQAPRTTSQADALRRLPHGVPDVEN